MIREQQVVKSVRFNALDVSLDLEESEDSDEESESGERYERASTPLRSPPPATPTPSPTYSSSTLESSNGPFTPPNRPFLILSSPKGTLSIEPLNTASPAIPKLAPVLSSAFRLRWDMKENPADIIKLLPLDGGNDPAGTLPSGEPIWRMVVVHDALTDWPLHIVASNDRVLAVHQVLSSIHDHLMKMVRGDHFNSLESDAVREEIIKSYNERTGTNSRDGLRRIDYLQGRVFVGLSVRAVSDGEWEFLLNSES